MAGKGGSFPVNGPGSYTDPDYGCTDYVDAGQLLASRLLCETAAETGRELTPETLRQIARKLHYAEMCRHEIAELTTRLYELENRNTKRTMDAILRICKTCGEDRGGPNHDTCWHCLYREASGTTGTPAQAE
jgi:hypothetical protein